MTCQYCGTKNVSGALACERCGRPLGTSSPTPPLARISTQPAAPAGSASDSSVRPPRAISLLLASGQQFTLYGKSDYAIGRIGIGRNRPDVDLAPWYGYEAGVSRDHIVIHVREQGVFIEDMDSANETIHNGFRLMPRQWYHLHDGDQLRLGALALRVTFQSG